MTLSLAFPQWNERTTRHGFSWISVYLRPFRSPGYFHGNGIARKSPGNQFKSPYSYISKPRGPFMATCRAQTSLQPPLAPPDASSHCLLGFLLFLKFFKVSLYNSRDERYIKAPTATSKRREATSRGAWESFISKLPACRHYIIKCSIFLQFYAVLESAQKCALLRAKGIKNHSVFEFRKQKRQQVSALSN